MYAIFSTGGKQYKVSEGDWLDIEKIEGDETPEVSFHQVLALGDGNDIKIGCPFIEGALVLGTVVEQRRGPKIRIFKMKRRKGYRKRQGHRQEITRIKITAIQSSTEPAPSG